MKDGVEFTRIRNDINGNPRYVCHFLNLNTEYENSTEFWSTHGMNTISVKYSIAVKRSHKLGGRKYHNKSYGGGIVFQSYNIRGLEQDIIELVKSEDKAYTQQENTK